MYTSLMLRLCVCRATEIMVGVSWNEQKRLRKVSWKFEDTDLYIEYKYIYIYYVSFCFWGGVGGGTVHVGYRANRIE